jgi:aminopeptidase N
MFLFKILTDNDMQKSKLTLIILSYLFLTSSILPQDLENITPADFYEFERQNWTDKIIFEANNSNDSTFDVTHYEINLDIPLGSSPITGKVTCNFIAGITNLSSVSLQLSSSFTIDSVAGNVLQYCFANDTINITLDRNYNAGEQVSVTIYYSGIPPVLNNTKGMRFETHGNNEPIIVTLSTPYLAHLWFPCKDGPGDKADSVYINITVPDTVINGNQLIATSNGSLSGIETSDGKRTFKWKELYPIIPYYIMSAVSNYSHFQQTINNSGDTFPIDYYVFKEDSMSAVSGTLDLPDVMNLFIEKFGSYPFENEKYGMSQLGFYGAIENQTNTIQNRFTLGWFMITVHELAHMWFGDMITCINWHHGWLNEGFATYSEALWTEHLGGFNGYKNYLNILKYTGGGTVYLQDTSNPFDIFLTIIYDKGAWVLHMLRGVLGDDYFFNVLSQYTSDTRFKYDHASTEDFKEVCEAVSGMELDFFFDQWIYDEYYPVYSYGYEQETGTNILTLQINQTQGQNNWREIFEMPIDIKINFTNGSDTLFTVWNDQVSTIYNFPLTAEVNSVEIDPDEWILRDVEQVTDVMETQEKLFAFNLGTNYPNPFNPSTTISFSIPARASTTLVVYDILGNEITTLINEEREGGNYTISFDASDLTSGIYFYRLTSGGISQSRKMLLIK